MCCEWRAKPSRQSVSERRCRAKPCRPWPPAPCTRQSGRYWPPAPRWHALPECRQPGAAGYPHPRGNHRNAQRITDRAGNTQVEAVLHAVLVHAGQQDLASAKAFHLLRPLDCIQPGRLAPAVGEDFPAWRFTWPGHLLGIDGDNDALRTETVRRLAHKLRVEHRSRVDRNLVGTGVEQVANVLHGTHATAHGQRDEHLAGHALDGMQGGVAAIDAGGDVEEGDFVGTLLVVATGNFHRVAGITDVLELDALDHPAVVHVQARDDALGQCHGSVLSLGSCRRRPGPRRHRGCLHRWHGR